MAYAVHKMPQIGELAPGYWLASAFGGHGLNTTAMAGEMIARAILDGDDRWRLFSSYELVWAGGAVRAHRGADLVLADAAARCRLHETDFALSRSGAARVRGAAGALSKPRRRRARREAEARRAEEEARRVAEKEARRLAAEEARRVAAENARLAKEEVERLREERRLAAEEAKRAAEAQVMRDAAEAAATLVRQVEAHKALTAGGEAQHATQPTHGSSGESAAAPQPTESSDETGEQSRKRRGSKKKKAVSEPAPPAT